jgi:MinD-like ATPase involved in chromosome partitioning or flagellar assembly
VFLLDLDVYAPSLQAYFDIEPKRWINDFLNGTAEVEDVVMDLTPSVEKVYHDSSSISSDISKQKHEQKEKEKEETKISGKLWVGFCNPKKEEIYKLEGGGGGKQDSSKIQLLRRFILLREQLISLHDADYIIIDTSPGIRYWSINALAVADTLFLTLKQGDLDIVGTRKMAEEIYGSFTKFGARSFLVMNRVAGYCNPPQISSVMFPAGSNSESSSIKLQQQQLQKEDSKTIMSTLADEVKMNVISSICCYCDIQFSNKEFLTVLKYPEHPFTKQFEQLAQIMEEGTESTGKI